MPTPYHSQSTIKNKKVVLGLTGGIASGKSTVLKLFKKFGAYPIDCDPIVKNLTRRAQPLLGKIVRSFGKAVLKRNGSLNRKYLAQLVFDNEQHRRKLEKLIHPEVIRIVKAKIASRKQGVIVVDIPLLFEAGLTGLVDYTIVVWVPQKKQIQRLLKRNPWTREEALQRIHAQWPLDKKKKLADFVIDNSGSLIHLLPQIKNILHAFSKSSSKA